MALWESLSETWICLQKASRLISNLKICELPIAKSVCRNTFRASVWWSHQIAGSPSFPIPREWTPPPLFSLFTPRARFALAIINFVNQKPACVCVSVAPPKKQHAKMRLFSSSSATQSWESVVFSFRSLCVRVSFIGASAGPFSLFRSHSFSLYFPKTATSRYTHWYMWIFASASRPFANIYTRANHPTVRPVRFVVGGGERKRVRESYWDVTRPEIYV